jgi:ketosteroid isomerase-like protein
VAVSPLDRYFDAIDSGDVERTTEAFREDALYIRPSLALPGTLDVVRGRDDLREFFRERGKKPFRHVVRSFVVDGPECFAEGIAIEDGTGAEIASFLVRASLDGDGRIARYFALMGGVPEGLDEG